MISDELDQTKTSAAATLFDSPRLHNRYAGDIGIRHFRNGKGTGAEMCPAIVSGIVTGDALLSPRSLCET